MNLYNKLILLQQLADRIDAKVASELEIQAFDVILEMLNEQNKTRSADISISNNTVARGFFVGTSGDSAS